MSRKSTSLSDGTVVTWDGTWFRAWRDGEYVGAERTATELCYELCEQSTMDDDVVRVCALNTEVPRDA